MIFIIAMYIAIGLALAMILPFSDGYGLFDFMKRKFYYSSSRDEFSQYLSFFVAWVVVWPLMSLPLLFMVIGYGSSSFTMYLGELGESMRKDK